MAGDGHQRVSSRIYSKETRSLTAWGQKMGTKQSATGFSAKRPDHLQPEGKRWVQKGQQQYFQQRDQITYSLRARDRHQRVSSRICSKETRSLTDWGQEMGAKVSAAGFATNRAGCLQAEGTRWAPKSQQQDQQQTDQITYRLRAGGGHKRVSSSICSNQTRSLTNWGQQMCIKGLAPVFAANKPDHLQAEGSRWAPKCQQQYLQQTDQTTYILRAADV